MKIGQYCQRQRCRHVELEQLWQAFASRGFVSDSWAFLFSYCKPPYVWWPVELSWVFVTVELIFFVILGNSFVLFLGQGLWTIVYVTLKQFITTHYGIGSQGEMWQTDHMEGFCNIIHTKGWFYIIFSQLYLVRLCLCCSLASARLSSVVVCLYGVYCG